jgi:hypothetical protein
MIARQIAKPLGVLFVIACSALPVMAQGTGEIGGRVIDATGAVVTGATVILIPAEGIAGGNQETVSDDRGAYAFTRLSPGVYSVRARLTGFRPVMQPGVRVDAAQTSRADLKLEVGDAEDPATGSAETALLDTTNALKQTVMTTTELEALPNRTDIMSVTKVMPGVVSDKIDVGGSQAAFSTSTVTIRGSSGTSKYMIDGMDVSSPSGNGTMAGFYLDPYSFEQTGIQLGAGSAENSNGGINFNMVTRSGTNRFHGGAKFNGTTPALANAVNYDEALKERLLSNVPARVRALNPDIKAGSDIQKMTDAGAWLGGPIVRDKLWFATSWHDQRLNQYYVGGYNPDGSQAIDDNVLWNVTGKISWQVTKRATLSYFTNIQYKRNGHYAQGSSRASFGEDNARQYVYKYPTVNQVRLAVPFEKDVVFDATYNRFRMDNAFLPEPGVSLGDIARYDTVTSSQSVAYPPGTCANGTCDGYFTTPLFRDQVRAGLTWVKSTHAIKVGYEFVSLKRDNRIWLISPFQANYADGQPVSVNTYTLPVGADLDPRDTIGILFSYRAQEHGVYIQDKWAVSRKVVINLGLRFETNKSWQPPACAPKSDFYAGACYGEIRPPSFKNFVPRSSVVYDIRGNGRTLLKASANRYDAPLGLDPLGRLNPISAPSDTRQWLPQSRCNDVIGGVPVTGCDRNGDLIPTLDELGTAPGYVFGGVNSRYADDLRRPTVNEFSVEFERQLAQGIVASVSYIGRQTRGNLGTVNTAVPASSWIGPMTVTEAVSGQTVQVWNRPSSASASLFSNDPSSDTDYKGVDVSMSKRMSHRWSLLGGSTFGRSRAATRMGNRNDPNILALFDSHPLTAADRPWSYRLSGVYQFPYDFFVSGTWQHQVGPPETTVVLVTNQSATLAQGNQSVQVAPVGDVRLPNVVQLDMNVGKTIKLSGARKLTPRVELFNMTNHATITSWVEQLGLRYHMPNGLQHGRLIKFEMSYDF